jgi:hypothetical protein
MKILRSMHVALLGIGASLVATRTVAGKPRGVADLSEAMDLGYSPENALPIAGQAGFADSSGVDCFEALRSLARLKSGSSSDAA